MAAFIWGIIFYCVVTPVAFVLRVFRYDPLARAFLPNAPSYQRKLGATSPRMDRQW